MTFFSKSLAPSHRFFNKSTGSSKPFFSKRTGAKKVKHHYDDVDREEKKKVSPLEKHHRMN